MGVLIGRLELSGVGLCPAGSGLGVIGGSPGAIGLFAGSVVALRSIGFGSAERVPTEGDL